MICTLEECNQPTKSKRSMYCSNAHGSTHRNRKHRAKHKDDPAFIAQKKEQQDRDRSTPYGKYVMHKHRAKQSGVAFLLTFNEWWDIWKPHWENRGLGKLVMCRLGDSGAYCVGNVRIDTQANNNREAHAIRSNRNG